MITPTKVQKKGEYAIYYSDENQIEYIMSKV